MKYIYDFEMIDIKTINILKILYNDFSGYYYEGEYYISNKSLYSNIIISFKLKVPELSEVKFNIKGEQTKGLFGKYNSLK